MRLVCPLYQVTVEQEGAFDLTLLDCFLMAWFSSLLDGLTLIGQLWYVFVDTGDVVKYNPVIVVKLGCFVQPNFTFMSCFPSLVKGTLSYFVSEIFVLICVLEGVFKSVF